MSALLSAASACNRLHDHTDAVLDGVGGLAARILQSFAASQGECMTTHGEATGWAGSAPVAWAPSLAQRLLEAGHDVAVYNRTRAKAEPLAELGATMVDSAGRPRRPRHRLHDRRPAPSDFEEVVLGDRRRALAVRRGPVDAWSTPRRSRPASERGPRRAAETRGTAVLAAPVERQPQGRHGRAADHRRLRPGGGLRAALPVPRGARPAASPTSATAIAPAWSRSATT